MLTNGVHILPAIVFAIAISFEVKYFVTVIRHVETTNTRVSLENCCLFVMQLVVGRKIIVMLTSRNQWFYTAEYFKHTGSPWAVVLSCMAFVGTVQVELSGRNSLRGKFPGFISGVFLTRITES